MNKVKAGTASLVLRFPPLINTSGDLATGITTSTSGFKLYIEVSGEGTTSDPTLLSSGDVLASFAEGKISDVSQYGGYSVTLTDSDYLDAAYAGKIITAIVMVQSGSDPMVVEPTRSESVKVVEFDENANELPAGTITPGTLADTLKPINARVAAVISTGGTNQTLYTIVFEDYNGAKVSSGRITGSVKGTVKSVGASPTTMLNDVTFTLMTGENLWYYVGTGGADLTPGLAYVFTNVSATIDGDAKTFKPLETLGASS